MITFILVNYNSEKETRECIESVFKIKNCNNLEIIIVNNDDNPLAIAGKNIKIIENKQNLGFAKAANQGASISSNKILCFINPDTFLVSQDISPLVNILSEKENVALVGGRILSTKGKPQPWSIGKSITPIEIIKNNIGINSSRKFWETSETSETDWISGAFMLIKKDDFFKVNGFDERFFMYFEDVDLCKRIREAGKKILTYPNFKIIHKGGRSFTDKGAQKILYYESQDKYIEKHFGNIWKNILQKLRKIFIK